MSSCFKSQMSQTTTDFVSTNLEQEGKTTTTNKENETLTAAERFVTIFVTSKLEYSKIKSKDYQKL